MLSAQHAEVDEMQKIHGTGSRKMEQKMGSLEWRNKGRRELMVPRVVLHNRFARGPEEEGKEGEGSGGKGGDQKGGSPCSTGKDIQKEDVSGSSWRE